MSNIMAGLFIGTFFLLEIMTYIFATASYVLIKIRHYVNSEDLFIYTVILCIFLAIVTSVGLMLKEEQNMKDCTLNDGRYVRGQCFNKNAFVELKKE